MHTVCHLIWEPHQIHNRQHYQKSFCIQLNIKIRNSMRQNMKTNRKKLNIEKWKSGATQLGIKYCFLNWLSPVCCPRWTYCGMCLPHLACALSMLLMYMQFTDCTANTFIHCVVFYEHTHACCSIHYKYYIYYKTTSTWFKFSFNHYLYSDSLQWLAVWQS